LRGFYAVALSVPEFERLTTIFDHILNYEVVEQAPWIDEESDALIYATHAGGGPGSEVWLLEQPHLPRARLGAGGTHHVAFRVPNFETQKDWHAHLSRAGLRVSGLIDRFWFRSIYFRVSSGILFEIATDGPGFAVDETPESLGEKLVLPPFLEGRRQEIEADLIPIGA
jgi:glyoxalase family protein